METKHHVMAASAVLVAFAGGFSFYNLKPYQASAAASAEATTDYAATIGFRTCAQDLGRVSVHTMSRDIDGLEIFTTASPWNIDDRTMRSESDSLWRWGNRFEPIGIDGYQFTMEAVGDRGIEGGDMYFASADAVKDAARAFIENPTERMAHQELWNTTQDMRRLSVTDRVAAIYDLCLTEGRMFNYVPGAAARIVAADDLANESALQGTFSVLMSLADPRAAIDARAAKLNPPIRRIGG